MATGAATPALAQQTAQTRCDSGKMLAAAKFAQCRLKVAALAVKKGDRLGVEERLRLEQRCAAKASDTFQRLEAKYPPAGAEPGSECSHYGDAPNLLEALALVSEMVADGSIASSGSEAFDPTSNDPEVCEAVGGTWDDGACSLESPYNCTLAAFCSSIAAALPGELPYYSNAYTGHELGSGPAAACSEADWSAGVSYSIACGGHTCLTTAAAFCG